MLCRRALSEKEINQIEVLKKKVTLIRESQKLSNGHVLQLETICDKKDPRRRKMEPVGLQN